MKNGRSLVAAVQKVRSSDERLYPRIYRQLRRLHGRLVHGKGGYRAFAADRIEVAQGPARDRFVAALTERLTSMRIPFTEGGQADEFRPRIHIREADAEAALEAVMAVAAAAGGPVMFSEPKVDPLPVAQLRSRFRLRKFFAVDLDIYEQLSGGSATAPAGTCSVVGIDIWHDSPYSFRENYVVAPRYNDVCTSMRRDAFDRVLGADGGERQPTLASGEAARNLYDRDFEIDLVYTWVDDQDSQWRKIKNSYTPGAKPAAVTLDGSGEGRADHIERFRNRDELKYSLRSIEMFAPFVRKIFLVTMDQTPEWLDTSDPRIEVVSHSDIYADQSALPTFNSSSIETQLHHIDGLAEHFIYFNDDVFLGRPCSWTDFFAPDGSAKFFPANHTVAASVINDSAEEYLVADKNAIRLFAETFGYVVHRQMAHVPHAARRSVLSDLEERFQDHFDACQQARFRSTDDLRPIAFMGHHYGFATGRAVPSEITERYLALWKPVIGAQLSAVLKTRKYKTFCINDVGVAPEREQEVDTLVRSFLESYFPFPSAFEVGSSKALGTG